MVNKRTTRHWNNSICREIEVLRLSSSLMLTCAFNPGAVLTREPRLSNDNCVISADTFCERWHELLKDCTIVSLSMQTNYQPQNKARETSKGGRPAEALGSARTSCIPPCQSFVSVLNAGDKRAADWCGLVYSLCTCVPDRTPWRWCSSVSGRTVERSWAQPPGYRGTFEPSIWGKAPVVSRQKKCVTD